MKHQLKRNICKRLLTLLNTSSLISLVLVSGCDDKQALTVPEPKPRPVKVMVISEGINFVERDFPATVRAAERIELSFEVAGKIIKLPAQEGQLLEKGALVAQLDERDFRSTFNEAKARFTNAAGNFNRAKDLLEKKFISPAEYDRLQSNMEVSRAQMEKAEKALNSTQLLAPFTGRIATRHVENFQEIQAKQSIVSLQGSDILELVVNVHERIMATVRNAQSEVDIKAEFDGLPGKLYDLTIKEFSTQADPITQTFRFVLQMPRPKEGNILPGMTATVKAKRRQADSVPTYILPTSAIASDPSGQPQVWLVEVNSVQPQAVTLGDLVGKQQVFVKQGIKAEDVVVIAGISKLRKDMKVRPVTKVAF